MAVQAASRDQNNSASSCFNAAAVEAIDEITQIYSRCLKLIATYYDVKNCHAFCDFHLQEVPMSQSVLRDLSVAVVIAKGNKEARAYKEAILKLRANLSPEIADRVIAGMEAQFKRSRRNILYSTLLSQWLEFNEELRGVDLLLKKFAARIPQLGKVDPCWETLLIKKHTIVLKQEREQILIARQCLFDFIRKIGIW